MLAVATSVDTFERLLSPVETSVVPTTSFGFEPPAFACTSKRVSGRMRYIVPSFQRTSAVPFGPVLTKSPSWSGMLWRSVSQVVRFARWICTVPATSATCASLLMTAPAMIFSAVDFTSSAVLVARSFCPAVEVLARVEELLVGRGDLAAGGAVRPAVSSRARGRPMASAISCAARRAESSFFTKKKTPPATRPAITRNPTTIRTSICVET